MRLFDLGVLAVCTAVGGCQMDDVGSEEQPLYGAPGDLLVTDDNNAHPQVVLVKNFAKSWCTGSIIASNKVLTAAHCVFGAPANNVDVYLDNNASAGLVDSLDDLPSIAPFQGRLRWTVESIWTHSVYDADTDHDVDIAILTMESSIPPTLIPPFAVLGPILPSPYLPQMTGLNRWTGYYAAIFGAGRNDVDCETGAPSLVQRFEMEVLTVPLGPNWFPEYMFKDSSGWGSYTCKGDSGSPILTTDADYIGLNNVPSEMLISMLSSSNGKPANGGGQAVAPMLNGIHRPDIVQHGLDVDGDGIESADDNCDHTYNPNQTPNDIDTDGDGWPDLNCDEDDDNDGIPDYNDNCDTVANPGQENADNDSFGDACDWDTDGDMIANDDDNCPEVANEYQLNCNLVAEQENFGNSSGVHLGDACDPVPCAQPKPLETEFVFHSLGAGFSGSEYICHTSFGRSIQDLTSLTSMISSDAQAQSSTDVEVWFCPCEADTAEACAAPPWNCGLSPNAATVQGSNWLPLSLVDSADMSTPVSQPVSVQYQPWSPSPPPNSWFGWNYLADFQNWVVGQQIWTPTAADATKYGAGTDMTGMLWVEDSTNAGTWAHGGCNLGGCSMAGSHLTEVAPDRATEIITCKKIPQHKAAPWWTFCATCLDFFRLPWEGLTNPALSFLPEAVVLYSDRMADVSGWVPGGGVDVSEHFSSDLLRELNNSEVQWVGPSDSSEIGAKQARAMGLSMDATKLIGEIVVDGDQFALRSTPSETEMSSRMGFATAYSAKGGTLFVGGGQSRGKAIAELWSYQAEAGWQLTKLDSERVPMAAESSVYSGADRNLWFIDNVDGRKAMGRIDTVTGRVEFAETELLSEVDNAWLIGLGAGKIGLVTTGRERYEITELVWGKKGLEIAGQIEGDGTVVAHPSVNGQWIGIGVETRNEQGVGITQQAVDVLKLRQ